MKQKGAYSTHEEFVQKHRKTKTLSALSIPMI